ncbi:unnamed protein product [Ceratitis capitata]|uniref:(Mediterranean fruit fly) hypothetical protein n=1 Tax=Ceratitis capitata TaxID=7213 RepID=A0A811VFX5_CERCA|nr:unnamed protein product [Ceratitis capitata]
MTPIECEFQCNGLKRSRSFNGLLNFSVILQTHPFVGWAEGSSAFVRKLTFSDEFTTYLVKYVNKQCCLVKGFENAHVFGAACGPTRFFIENKERELLLPAKADRVMLRILARKNH